MIIIQQDQEKDIFVPGNIVIHSDNTIVFVESSLNIFHFKGYAINNSYEPHNNKYGCWNKSEFSLFKGSITISNNLN